MKRTNKKVTALIPCFNEAESLEAVLRSFPTEKLRTYGYDLTIIVINNNSTDDSARIARQHGVRVIDEPRRGKGNAMRRGFAAVTEDTDYVVMLDGDNTYRPEEILRLLELLDSGFCDVALGSRLGGRIHDGSMTLCNRAGNWIFSHLVRSLYRVNVTDVLTGYFAWRREALTELRPHLRSDGFAIEMEMITKMARLGQEIYCVPISYHPRVGSVSNLHPLKDGSRILLMLMRNTFWRPERAEAPRLPSCTKNILIVSSYYPPHVGGLEIVVKSQAELLSAAGHRVTVVTSGIAAEGPDCLQKNLTIIRVGAWNIFERWGVPFPIFSPQFLLVLFRQTRTADIVHIHDAFYMSSFLAALCARVCEKPIVLTQHVEMIMHPNLLVKTMQRLVYATTGAIIFRLSARIITLNDRVELFLLNGGIHRSKLQALSNGVDLSLFHPVTLEHKQALRRKYHLSPHKKIILFVGRFVPKKGVDKLLAAQSEYYQIVLVGNETPRQSSENVVFLGPFPQSVVAEIYQAADIFVLPSEGEGFPLSVQEAMATGLPIITTYDAGYRRYHLDEKLIYFLDQPSESSVRRAITTIVNDDVHLEKMSSYSTHYARSYFGWPEILPKLLAIYDALLT